MKKPKPIAFSTPMVRATRRENNPKTMTRRVIKPQPKYIQVLRDGRFETSEDGGFDCDVRYIVPSYQPGDILWVREEHYAYGCWMQNGTTPTGRQKYRFVADYNRPVYYCDTLPPHVKLRRGRDDVGYFKRLGRFMPYRLARTFITVTAVRAERLQDITEEDAMQEGVKKDGLYMYIDNFRFLWDSLNSQRGHGWDANDWVYVYTFARCEKPEEASPW